MNHKNYERQVNKINFVSSDDLINSINMVPLTKAKVEDQNEILLRDFIEEKYASDQRSITNYFVPIRTNVNAIEQCDKYEAVWEKNVRNLVGQAPLWAELLLVEFDNLRMVNNILKQDIVDKKLNFHQIRQKELNFSAKKVPELYRLIKELVNCKVLEPTSYGFCVLCNKEGKKVTGFLNCIACYQKYLIQAKFCKQEAQFLIGKALEERRSELGYTKFDEVGRYLAKRNRAIEKMVAEVEREEPEYNLAPTVQENINQVIVYNQFGKNKDWEALFSPENSVAFNYIEAPFTYNEMESSNNNINGFRRLDFENVAQEINFGNIQLAKKGDETESEEENMFLLNFERANLERVEREKKKIREFAEKIKKRSPQRDLNNRLPKEPTRRSHAERVLLRNKRFRDDEL